MRKEKLLDCNNYYFKEQSPKGSNGSHHKNIGNNIEDFEKKNKNPGIKNVD